MFAAPAVLALLLGASAAPAAAPATVPASDAGEGTVELVDDDEDNPDFEPSYFAFSTNENPHSSIEDEQMIFHIAGLLGCIGGQIWLPLLILDDQPDDYITEALISWLIWGVPVAILSVLGPLAWIGWIAGLFVHFYIIPVNVYNAWDRAARTNGMKESRKSKKKKRKKSDDDGDSGDSEEGASRSLPEEPRAAMAF